MTSEQFEMLLLVALIATMAWVISAVALPLFVAWAADRTLPPQTRLQRLTWAAAAPWLMVAAVAAGLGMVAFGKAVGLLDDHCLFHAPGHPHFCFEHLGMLDFNFVTATLLVLAATAFAMSAWQSVARETASAGLMSSLAAVGRSVGRVRVLDSAHPSHPASSCRPATTSSSAGSSRARSPRASACCSSASW